MSPSKVQGTLEHILLYCKSLHEKRQSLLALVSRVSGEHPVISAILEYFFTSDNPKDLLQLLLDCTVIPCVISASQLFGKKVIERLLYLGRTWCYNIHRERVTQLGLLKFR